MAGDVTVDRLTLSPYQQTVIMAGDVTVDRQILE